MKTQKQISKEALTRVIEIIENVEMESLHNCFHSPINRDSDVNLISLAMFQMISENSNDFTKDIADRFLDTYEYKLSYKQAWAMAYQIKNNIAIYKTAVTEYSEWSEETTEESEVIEITAITDGTVKNETFELNIEDLKSKAYNMVDFETGYVGKSNPSPKYMHSHSGIKVINDNGNYAVYQIGNHDSFFCVNKLFDINPQQIKLTYILAMRIKESLK